MHHIGVICMTRAAKFRDVAIAILTAIAALGATWFVLTAALIIYAEVHYPHPGSMTPVWAFVTSFPYALFAGLVGMGMILKRLTRDWSTLARCFASAPFNS